MTIIISRVINLFSIFVFNLDRHAVPRDYILGKFPWRKRWDSDINSWLVVSAERHEYWERKAWKVGGATVKLLITALDLISLSSNSATVFWSIIELFIGELNNQGRCNRHARQLYGSAAGNSGDFFFSPLVFANLWFFAPNFIFLRKWRQWRSVTRTLIEPGTSWSPVGCSSDWASEAGERRNSVRPGSEIRLMNDNFSSGLKICLIP